MGNQIVGGTFTYSGDPSADSKDAVRFLIGDTNGADQLVSDEEILWTISEEGSDAAAASRVLRSIAAGYARAVTKEVGDLKIQLSDKHKHYLGMAEALEEDEAEAAVLGGVPFAGGISRARRETNAGDTDLVDPSFAPGQFDHPGNSQPGGRSNTSVST